MSHRRSSIGVLLVQLGTPESAKTSDVRRYLREFLSDPRVIDIPAPARALLLNAIILPFRPRRSAEAYRKIWTDEGSPLLIHTERLAAKVSGRLGADFRVEVAMRYGNPSIETAIESLVDTGCERMVVLPLFPQYASAAGGSAVARVLEVAGVRWNVPEITTIGPFYDHPGFIGSVAEVMEKELAEADPQHILFSYHGLPERQVRKSDPTGSWCLAEDGCCASITELNAHCYRAQAHATTRALAQRLGLVPGSYSTSFQSRLAGQKWIEPYTDKVLEDLSAQGVRRLAVVTPSFTADCLETIEEVGIRGVDQWESLGGEELVLVSCVNASERWADAVTEMIIDAVSVHSVPDRR